MWQCFLFWVFYWFVCSCLVEEVSYLEEVVSWWVERECSLVEAVNCLEEGVSLMTFFV
jgi:hypothetical protein